MSTKQTEALKLALEALEQIDEAMPFPVAKLAQKVIREALAEQPAIKQDLTPEQNQCKFPLCHNEDYQQALAEQIKRELYTGETAQPQFDHTAAANAALRDAQNRSYQIARAAQQQQQEPVAWRDHVEQRLLIWRQSFVNKSGDQLALDDFMDKRSLDDMIDFVCSEYTSPPASKPWVGLTDEELEVIANECRLYPRDFARAIEAKLREKNA